MGTFFAVIFYAAGALALAQGVAILANLARLPPAPINIADGLIFTVGFGWMLAGLALIGFGYLLFKAWQIERRLRGGAFAIDSEHRSDPRR